MTTMVSRLIVELIDQVTAPARAISTTVDRLTEAQTRNTERMNEMRGQMVDAAAGAYALARAIGRPVQVAADFQTAMNKVSALSGATGGQFDALRRQALELGRTTQYTASQAGDAMGFLAMAGFEANDILGAMPGTLQLAAAAQMDLARTADVVTNILTGYNKPVSELAHVNDVLVKAFTSANTDLSQLADAMKYAGPVAVSAGVQFEEATAALSLMGNAGIQGSMAGTSLRGAITRIVNPTKQVREAMVDAGLSFTDANGRLLGLADIIQQLEPHAENTGLMMRLFGQRAGPAMAALVSQGHESVRALTKELEESGGTAERVADVQMAGFNGMMRQFWSAVEGLQIALGDALIPTLTDLAEILTISIAPLTALAERYPALTRAVIATVGGLVALRVASIASRYAFFWMKGAVLSGAIAGMRALGMAVTLATLPLAALQWTARAGAVGLLTLLNPIRLVTVALRVLRVALISTGIGAILVGIAAAGLWIYNNWSGIRRMFIAFGNAFMEAVAPIMPTLSPIIDGIEWLRERVSSLLGPVDGLGQSWFAMGRNAGRFVGEAVASIVQLPRRIMEVVSSSSWTEIGEMIAAGVSDGFSAIVGLIASIITSIDWAAHWSAAVEYATATFAGIAVAATTALSSIDWAGLWHAGVDLASAAFARVRTIVAEAVGAVAASLSSIDWAAHWSRAVEYARASFDRLIAVAAGAFAAIDWAGLWAAALDHAAATFDRIASVIVSALSSIDWAGLWASAADLASAAFDRIASALAAIDWLGAISGASAAISGLFNAAADAMLAVDWGNLGVRLGEMIAAGLAGILNLGRILLGSLSGDGASSFAAIGSAIASGILAFDWAGVGMSILRYLGAALRAGGEFMAGILRGLFGNVDLGGAAAGIVDSLVDGVAELSERMIAAGRDLMRALFEGIKEVMAEIVAYIRDSLTDALSAAQSGASRLLNRISFGYLGRSGEEEVLAAPQAAMQAANDNAPPTSLAQASPPVAAVVQPYVPPEPSGDDQIRVEIAQRRIAEIEGQINDATDGWPQSAYRGIHAFVDALAAGGADAEAEAARIGAGIEQELSVTGHPDVDTGGLERALTLARQLGEAMRSLPSASISAPATGIAGARAGGGPVRAGGAYLVGEEGPELVTFGRDGFVHDAMKTARIVRNAALAAAGMALPAAAMPALPDIPAIELTLPAIELPTPPQLPALRSASDSERGGRSVEVTIASGAIKIEVTGAPGQSKESIAEEVERRLSARLNALSRGAFSDGAN